jgi:methionine sulfoxide reductase heme-binding subunit
MPAPIRILKPAVFLLCLVPLGMLIWAIVYNPQSFGANPFELITDRTGDWTLRFVLFTLSISPIRVLTGWNAAIRFRRMVGLFAFFYASLHFLTYVWFTKYFNIDEITKDVVKRPFITVGFAAFILMIPLTITSTKKWIGRLGGKRWQKLHMAIYVIGILGVIHFFWRVKSDITDPLIYAVLLSALFLVRIWNNFRTPAVVR